MIYLISRDTQYSPNREARDEAIFKAVALALSLQGEPIAAIDENRLPAAFSGADLVLSMARSRTAQTALAAAEATGLTIWNSPAALLRHSRADLDGWFNEAGCGAPFLHKVTDPALTVRTLGLPLWLKRSDSAAKIRLGKAWENACRSLGDGRNYAYMIVFEQQRIDGAYGLAEALTMLARL